MRDIFVCIFACFTVGCSIDNRRQASVCVSIEPLAWIATSLLDSTVYVSVLVPDGASAETYEPTAIQMTDLANSAIFLNTGLLDFERELARRLPSIARSTTIVDLSEGVDVMAGQQCQHSSPHGSAGHQCTSNGADPHIWLSPDAMRVIISHVAQCFIDQKLDDEQLVIQRRDSLLAIVDFVDRQIVALRDASDRRSFAIVHPSLSYFARDYGLRQIALEIEGKDPSASTIGQIVDTIVNEGITTIFYNLRTSNSAATVIAKEVGAELVQYDPLDYHWEWSMIKIAKQIYGTSQN